jgi:pSer/pThr/pTyr-binding forkhead associated (FHA) protein
MDEGSAPAPMPMSPASVPSPALAEVAPQPQVAKLYLTLILPDGTEGGRHDLAPGKNKLGRQMGPVFEDSYLSPIHAELDITGATAILKDLESLNGVFIKITEEEELAPGQIFRIGQELLRFDPIEPRAPSLGETERLGSPNPGYWGRLTVLLDDDLSGSAHALLGDAVTLGRSRGEINFGEDAYVSGLHARIARRDGKAYLSDLGSANGTFVKVTQRKLVDGAHLLLGQQLFRITLTE